MLNLVAAIPGLGHDSAAAILAEVGPDMKQFPTWKKLSSWAGMCPSNKKSAGKNLAVIQPVATDGCGRHSPNALGRCRERRNPL